MSVIVAKSSSRCSTGTTTSTVVCDYYPAIATEKTIAVGTTSIIDSVSMSQYRAAKWLIVVSNSSFTRVQSCEVYATHRAGNFPTHNMYAILGNLDVVYEVSVSTGVGSLNLNIKNTDAEVLTVYATRIGVPLSPVAPSYSSHVEIVDLNTVVRTGSTELIDFIPIASNGFLAGTWSITVTSATGERAASRLFARLTTGAAGTEYAIIGNSALTYDIIVTEVSGLGIEISLSNTSAFDYAVDVTRIPVNIVASLQDCIPGNSDTRISVPQALTIPAGGTKVIDVLSPNYLSGAKWLFGAKETTSNRTMAGEIYTTNETASSAVHVLYGLIADDMDLQINTAVVAGRTTLEITNNELNPVLVNLLRVPVVA